MSTSLPCPARIPAHLGSLRGLACALLVAALSFSFGGCNSNDEYAVVVSWAVNGFAPTQAECDFHGIKSVRLTIPDGARKRTIEGECARSLVLASDGFQYGGFVSTEFFEYGAVYSYQLDMIGTNGEVLIPNSGTFVADWGQVVPVELPTLDFFAPVAVGGEIATVTGSFSVGADEDLAQACAAAGMNRVELWVYSVLDFEYAYPARALYAPCDSGVLDSGTPLLNPGEYYVTYVALDYESEQRFTVIEESDLISVYVDEPGNVPLTPWSFAAP